MNAVDKYDYKVKTEQMLELMEDGAYRQAAEIADTIDWKRVRNTGMLANVSEIYEKNKEYQKGYEVLNFAYRRAEGSRKIISRLCTLALKTDNVDEAIDYYDDFIQIAPKDPNQYILRYQILRAQRAPIEQQIEALEEYKKSEYIEEWAYELAKLYQEAGMTAECLEECDDLILWFSEGQYVYKAMELKMQYKPLTPSQQEKYDRRYEKLSAETEEIPDVISYAEAEYDDPDDLEADGIDAVGDADDEEDEDMPEGELEESVIDEDLSPEEDMQDDEEVTDQDSEEEAVPQRKKIGDTMPLDEALRQLLRPGRAGMADENEEPELDDLAEEIDEIESVADIDIIAQIAEEKKRAALAAGEMTEIMPEETQEIPFIDEEDEELIDTDAEELFPEEELSDVDAEELLPEEEELGDAEAYTDTNESEMPAEEEGLTDADAEAFLTEAGEITDAGEEYADALETETLSKNDDQITGQMSLEDILAGWEGEPEADLEDTGKEEELFNTELEDAADPTADETAESEQEELPAAELSEAGAEDMDEDLFDADAEEAEEVLDEEDGEELTDDLPEGDVTGDMMETKNKTTPILPPDIQRMIDEIEGIIPPEEEKPAGPVKRTLERKPAEPLENMGRVTESLRIDEEEDLDFSDDAEEFFEEGAEFDHSEEYLDEGEDLLDEEEYFDEGEEFEDDAEYFGDIEEDAVGEDALPEDAEEYFDEGETLENEIPDIDEEFRVNPEHAEQEDDREIPDDDDDNMDILSATTPLSRKETAKMIATGKTAPLPLDEISDALSMSDTGFIVHGRYDLELQSGIGTRAGLTEEQKKLFSYFVPVRGMSEQLVDVLEQDKNCTNRNGTSKSGNLLIIGNKGSGKTVLAVDVVKAIQKQRSIKQGKVAIVTGDSLNKKKISDIFDKLYGGALIIEKAGKMDEKTVARLNKAMERDTGELLIVLEEQRKPLDRLLSSNREFRRKFTSRLEIPIFINDELVTFGQTYAQENGYRIDEMGILALYSKIDSLQREDHAVTVAEVKEIMDEAIQHSQKASAKKLMKRVFGKNTDEADRIILSEKDFNI